MIGSKHTLAARLPAAVALLCLSAAFGLVAAEEKPVQLVPVERLKPGERSKVDSPDSQPVGIAIARIIGSNGPGRLISVDYIHRTGRYYRADFRDVIDFHLPPEGFVRLSGAEADLRDVPIGAECMFQVRGEIEPRDSEVLRVHVLDDERLTDDERQRAYDKQYAKFAKATKARGLPGRITASDSKSLSVEFFSGRPEYFRWRWLPEFAVGKEIRSSLANEELRTWNPPVDAKTGTITKVEQLAEPTDGFSGVRITFELSDKLAGVRPGRIVRVFGPGWKVPAQLHGESLSAGDADRPVPDDLKENPAKEHPERFPYRTDFGNAHLPWHQLQPGHNWSGLSMALRGTQISDFPLCNKSFNLSYCGFDL